VQVGFGVGVSSVAQLENLKAEVSKLCKERNLVDEQYWVDKVMQVMQIQEIHHGVIMVGPAGTGKSTVSHCRRTRLLDHSSSACLGLDHPAGGA
jgi:hypothetical protein